MQRKTTLVAIFVLAIVTFLTGCVAHITPEGTYLEPLPAEIVIGPPVVVAAPPHIRLRALPPVYYYPSRASIYLYDDVYYYYRSDRWYYSEHRRGPWHKLPRQYYPPSSRRYDRGDHDRGRGRGRGPR